MAAGIDAPVMSPGMPGISRTSSPIVTGTSVLGMKYKGGVMLAADTMASYGSLARFWSIERLKVVSDKCVVGFGGEHSDMQAISDFLDELVRDDKIADDGFALTAPEVHSYLTRVLYNRRNKMSPLWNTVVVSGLKPDGTEFLGYVDMIGTAFEDNFVATGYGKHLAIPLMRDRWHADLTEGEARGILEDCMRVLYYRDCKAINKIQLAKIEIAGGSAPLISSPYALPTKWDYRAFVTPKAGADTGGSW